MAFSKVAFAEREHAKITAFMMGPRYDQLTFAAVQRYIDGMGGMGHREKHGHNEAAEKEIEKKWGPDGVEIFRIHILSDWLYDNLGLYVHELYRHLSNGEFPLPYYTDETRDNRPTIPSSLTAEPVQAGCSNCGSMENLEVLRTWFRGPICAQCVTERNLGVCVQCRSLFPSADRRESPENPGHYLCPVCAHSSHETAKS
jgi:hypothetical protein